MNPEADTGSLRRPEPAEPVREPAREPDDELLRCIYAELYGLARRNMRGQPVGHTLQPTALVNEAYLRLASEVSELRGKSHFLCLASRAMRQILVDHSRRRAADKRVPRNRLVDVDPLLDVLAVDYESRAHDLLALDVALVKLAAAHPQLAELVELNFFGGRSMAECAEVLGISERQAFRWWQTARAFLHREVES
jgi:RNA polymerase sigma-70 factor (ECF subfamily)